MSEEEEYLRERLLVLRDEEKIGTERLAYILAWLLIGGWLVTATWLTYSFLVAG